MRNRIILFSLAVLCFWFFYKVVFGQIPQENNVPKNTTDKISYGASKNVVENFSQILSKTNKNDLIPSSPLKAWEEMDSSYRKSTSYREFFYKAIKSPEKGGYFYAMKIVGECGSVGSHTSDSLSTKATQAAMVLRTRCDFNESDKEDGFRQFEATRNLNYKDDPLLKQMFDSITANSAEEHAIILQKALEDGNPSLISSFVDDKAEKLVVDLFGADNARSSEYKNYVLDLLACRLGESCGVQSTRNLVLCAENNWCESSVSDSIRIGNEKDFSALDKVAAELANAISHKSYKALIQ